MGGRTGIKGGRLYYLPRGQSLLSESTVDSRQSTVRSRRRGEFTESADGSGVVGIDGAVVRGRPQGSAPDPEHFLGAPGTRRLRNCQLSTVDCRLRKAIEAPPGDEAPTPPLGLRGKGDLLAHGDRLALEGG